MGRNSYISPVKIVMLLLILGLGWGQMDAQDRKGERRLRKGKIEKALKRYYRLAVRNPDSTQYLVRISQIYQQDEQPDKAVKWMGKAIAVGENQPSNQMAYGRLLMANGQYAEAVNWFEKLGKMGLDPRQVNMWLGYAKQAERLRNDSLGFKIFPISGLNSKYDDMCPAPYENGVLVTTNRRRGFFIRFSGKKQQRLYDLYFAKGHADGSFEEPRLLDGKLNTRLHDGPVSFPAGEFEAYITRSNLRKGKNKAADGFHKVGIYRHTKKNNLWKKGEELPFNNPDFNSAHGFIAPDGKTLYFSSDRPGGLGGFDIYQVRKSGNEWGQPENMGPTVNSSRNEAFPSLGGDSILYFASDREGGLGKLDIYFSTKNESDWGPATNAGYPLNSPYDDFGIVFERERPYGFITSDRPGGQGADDVYRFKRFPAIQGLIVDGNSGNPVPFATVEIMDLNENYHGYTTDSLGRFFHYVTVGQDAMIKVNKEGFDEVRKAVNIRKLGPGEDLKLDLELEPTVRKELHLALTDAQTGNPVKGAEIRLIGLQEEKLTTPEDGQIIQKLESGREYTVIIRRDGYRPEVRLFETEDDSLSRTLKYDISMVPGDFVFVTGNVVAKETGAPVPAAAIRVLDLKTEEELEGLRSRLDGKYWVSLPAGRDFAILAGQTGYLTDRIDVRWDSLRSDTVDGEISLVRVEPGRIVKTIYYGYNESDIQKRGRNNLKEIAYFLKENPGLQVELVSHTDARGTAAYNKRLSQQRADAAVAYLHRQGIPLSRVSGRGVGEVEPVNGCVDGRECNEFEHGQNRRTEVRVVGFEPVGGE